MLRFLEHYLSWWCLFQYECNAVIGNFGLPKVGAVHNPIQIAASLTARSLHLGATPEGVNSDHQNAATNQDRSQEREPVISAAQFAPRNFRDGFWSRLRTTPLSITTSSSWMVPSIRIEPKEKLSIFISLSSSRHWHRAEILSPPSSTLFRGSNNGLSHAIEIPQS